MSQERIKARVAGRRAAEELCDAFLMESVAKHPNHGADFAEALLERLAEALPKRRSPVKAVEKPEPIARLGATQIEFGQHRGKTFDQIDMDYLDWLCREQEQFLKVLRSYLKHPELEAHRR